jgi:amino acid transporter
MDIHDDHGTTVLRRTAETKPRHGVSTWLIGRPLSTADAPHQTIGKLIGLAVFSSDALSSVAYATQEMLVILAFAGAAAFGISIPLAIAIVVLLTILTLSYEQTIHAYPGGGGAYIVSRDNLGEIPAMVAASALLTDYILTVAVSISSGTAQLVSAFPGLYEFRVWISVAMVLFVMMINLRGVKEAGFAFALPTYFFVVMMYITVIVGIIRLVMGTLGVVDMPPMDLMNEVGNTSIISVFLILRAFSSGTTALTGVEAISNGITAFKEPRSKNAGKTLIWMALILGSLMLSVTVLAHQIGAMPSESETIISQIGRTVFSGRGILYLLVISSTTVILMMAANTAFADFPRLSALTAHDGFLPRQLAYRGSRLVYSRGIVALATIASILIIAFQASVNKLIPLYAIGVFTSFTLSQAGMAHRWWKSGRMKLDEEKKERGSTLRFESSWLTKMIVNGFGAFVTFIVTMIFAITKFSNGAYIVIILTPILTAILWMIHHHYRKLANKLSLDDFGEPPRITRHRVILTMGGVHRGTLTALRYARTLSDDITAVHISIDQEETARIQEKWEIWGEGIRLQILDSPYRLLYEPLLEYIDAIEAQLQPNEILTIIVPQFVANEGIANVLHARTADTLRKVLLGRKDIVITEVPYQVDLVENLKG